MEIVPYRKEYRQAFIDLNLAWLQKFFKVEPADREMLYGVERAIAAGAAVYFAVEKGCPAATCMVRPLQDGVWEICKFAADERLQGRGAGQAVFRACMAHAARQGAKKLLIISNRILKPALHIYEKAGFREVPLAKKEYERADIQLEYLVPSAAAVGKIYGGKTEI